MRRGRIKIAGHVLEWLQDALDALSAVVASLEPAIAVDAVELSWDHADPSDRVIGLHHVIPVAARFRFSDEFRRRHDRRVRRGEGHVKEKRP